MLCSKNRPNFTVADTDSQKNCRYLSIPINWHIPNYDYDDYGDAIYKNFIKQKKFCEIICVIN